MRDPAHSDPRQTWHVIRDTTTGLYRINPVLPTNKQLVIANDGKNSKPVLANSGQLWKLTQIKKKY
jgi:hypothetical protein